MKTWAVGVLSITGVAGFTRLWARGPSVLQNDRVLPLLVRENTLLTNKEKGEFSGDDRPRVNAF